jgi:hypothetical protein
MSQCEMSICLGPLVAFTRLLGLITDVLPRGRVLRDLSPPNRGLWPAGHANIISKIWRDREEGIVGE